MDKEIIDYKIITVQEKGKSHLGDTKVVDEVKSSIKRGWQPLGGVVINVQIGTKTQAMVKYKK